MQNMQLAAVVGTRVHDQSPVGLEIGIVLARLEHINKWNVEIVLHCENAAIIIAIPTAIQLLIKSRSTAPVHFCRRSVVSRSGCGLRSEWRSLSLKLRRHGLGWSGHCLLKWRIDRDRAGRVGVEGVDEWGWIEDEIGEADGEWG